MLKIFKRQVHHEYEIKGLHTIIILNLYSKVEGNTL